MRRPWHRIVGVLASFLRGPALSGTSRFQALGRFGFRGLDFLAGPC